MALSIISEWEYQQYIPKEFRVLLKLMYLCYFSYV